MVLRELITKLGFEMDKGALAQADRRFADVRSKAEKTGAAFRQMGGELTTFVTAPITLLGGAMAKMAADAEETESKFAVVFDGLDKKAAKAAQEISSGFGVAVDQTQELLANTGDILQGFGFNRDRSLELSTNINKIAADLVSFKNVQGGAEAASSALTKALLGEREALKGLGIAILEEDVKLKVAEMRRRGLTFESERQAKALATLEIITERSANAVGDFARTTDSTSNATRTLFANLRNLAVSFGKLINEALNPVIIFLRDLTKDLMGLSRTTKIIILGMAALAAAIGPVLLAIGAFLGMLPFLKAGLVILQGLTMKAAIAFALMAAKVLLIIGAVALVVLAFQDLYAFLKGGDSILGRMINKANELAKSFSRWVMEGIKPVTEWVESLMSKFRNFNNLISGFANKANNFIVDVFTPDSAKGNAAGNNVNQNATVNVNVDASGNANAMEVGERTGESVQNSLSNVFRQTLPNFN